LLKCTIADIHVTITHNNKIVVNALLDESFESEISLQVCSFPSYYWHLTCSQLNNGINLFQTMM